MARNLLLAIAFFISCSISISAQQLNSPQLDSLVKAYVAVNKFNGTALVIKDGKKVHHRNYGYQHAAFKKEFTKNNIFSIGSLTKSFTALVVLKLAEENKLSIQDPVSKYLPDYPRGNDIQLKHLLSNTSGIYEIFRNPKFSSQLSSVHTFSNEEKLAFFKNEPLDFEPGTQFSYCNSGFILLGIIIEKVTGIPYSDAVNNYIFKPLKMTNSGFDFPNLENKRKVTSYSFVSATKQAETKPWNASLISSTGGLYSSAEDLLKFYKGLTTFKIISKQSYDSATTPVLGGYGYGWYIDKIHDEKVINHGGNVEGATSYFLMQPEKNICIILLNNITSISLEKLGNAMYAALQNKPYSLPKPNIEISLEERILKKYT